MPGPGHGASSAAAAAGGRDSPGRDLEGKRRHRDQLPGAPEGQAGPGWGWPAAGTGAGWGWVGLGDLGWIWVGLGWVWERRGAAPAGIPHPRRLPKGHKATSPPFLVPPGGKFGAVVEGIQDSGGGAVFGFPGPALAPPRGLKHSCHIRNFEFQH